MERLVGDWRAGVAVVQANLSLRVLFASSVLSHVADGIFIVLGLSPLVLDVLGGTPAQVGWVASAQAIGGLTAGLVVVRIGHRMTRRWLYGGGAIGTGIADFGCANARLIAPPGTAAVGVAMGWMVLAGPPVRQWRGSRSSSPRRPTPTAVASSARLGSVNGIACSWLRARRRPRRPRRHRAGPQRRGTGPRRWRPAGLRCSCHATSTPTSLP